MLSLPLSLSNLPPSRAWALNNTTPPLSTERESEALSQAAARTRNDAMRRALSSASPSFVCTERITHTHARTVLWRR